MNIDFSSSRTKTNLVESFVGESQARERYGIASSFAKKEKLYIVSKAFETTANQEGEHAEVYYDFLKPFSSKSIKFETECPVDLFDSTLEFLKKAASNEANEGVNIYGEFGRVAKDEGFMDIANKFFQIAKIEKTHSERFSRLASLLERDELFRSNSTQKWVCLECGNVYEGTEVPASCPVCGHDRGYFIRSDLFWCIS